MAAHISGCGRDRALGWALAACIAGAIACPATAAAEASFNAPKGPLAQALVAFGRQTGLNVTYRPEIVARKVSPGAVNQTSPEAALSRILDGTGVRWRFSDPSTVELIEPVQLTQDAAFDGDGTALEEILVEGGFGTESAWGPVPGIVAQRSATGSKTDTPIIQTPQTINVVTAEEIRQRGAQTVDQALRYTPGVFTQAEGGSEGRRDTVFSRGFNASEYLDGLPLTGAIFGFGVTRIEPYGLERVELLKGPASVLYGRNSPGGVLNMVRKRPTAEPIREVEVSGGNRDRLQGAFDFSGALDPEARFLFRLTGLARDAEGAYSVQDDDRLFLAPSFTWRPSGDTSLTVLSHVQKDRTGMYTFAPLYGSYFKNPLGDVKVDRYWGDPDYDGYERTQWDIGYAFEHRFNERLQVRQNVRYGETEDDMRYTGQLGLLDDMRSYERYAFHYLSKSRALLADTQAIADVETGPLRHKIMVGLDYSRQKLTDGDTYDPSMDPPSWGGTFDPIDIFDPVDRHKILDGSYADRSRNTQTQVGLYVQDQIALDRWLATFGARRDWVTTRITPFPGDPLQKSDPTAFTVRAGLSYLFENGLAPYVSYSESFDPVVGLDRNDKAFLPTTGTQYEAGLKYQPEGFRGFFSAAVFDIRQQNVLTADPIDPLLQNQTGEAHVRGFEVEGKAEPTPELSLLASYSFLDSEVTKSGTPSELGKPFAQTPRHQASFWANYAFAAASGVSGLSLGGGVRYIGRYHSALGGELPVTPGAIFDAAASYDFGKASPRLKGVSLSVNALNLFDKQYYTGATRAGVTFGQRRTVYATLRYRW